MSLDGSKLAKLFQTYWVLIPFRIPNKQTPWSCRPASYTFNANQGFSVTAVNDQDYYNCFVLFNMKSKLKEIEKMLLEESSKSPNKLINVSYYLQNVELISLFDKGRPFINEVAFYYAIYGRHIIATPIRGAVSDIKVMIQTIGEFKDRRNVIRHSVRVPIKLFLEALEQCEGNVHVTFIESNQINRVRGFARWEDALAELLYLAPTGIRDWGLMLVIHNDKVYYMMPFCRVLKIPPPKTWEWIKVYQTASTGICEIKVNDELNYDSFKFITIEDEEKWKYTLVPDPEIFAHFSRNVLGKDFSSQYGVEYAEEGIQEYLSSQRKVEKEEEKKETGEESEVSQGIGGETI